MNPQLTDLETLQHYLSKEGVRPSRSSGQNFLISSEVIEAIMSCLEGTPSQVTELGAGTGVLTQALAASNFQVKAIERDEALLRILHAAVPAGKRTNVEVIKGDLKTASWSWPTPYALVGNIPYNLSGFILRRTTQLSPAPERVVFLVQQEVGERMVAQVPNMSLIGLAVSLWGTAEIMMRVPPNCFWPSPQVYSAVVLIQPHSEQLPEEEREAVLEIAKKFFQGKRKQIGGQMQRVFGLSPEEVTTICKEVGVSSSMRPQELSTQQWQAFAGRLRLALHK